MVNVMISNYRKFKFIYYLLILILAPTLDSEAECKNITMYGLAKSHPNGSKIFIVAPGTFSEIKVKFVAENSKIIDGSLYRFTLHKTEEQRNRYLVTGDVYNLKKIDSMEYFDAVKKYPSGIVDETRCHE